MPSLSTSLRSHNSDRGLDFPSKSITQHSPAPPPPHWSMLRVLTVVLLLSSVESIYSIYLFHLGRQIIPLLHTELDTFVLVPPITTTKKSSRCDLVLSTPAEHSGRLTTRLYDTWGFDLRVLKLSPENCPGFNFISLVGVYVQPADMFILFVLHLFFRLRVFF